MIKENAASRGTEASAEVLVGPPLGAGGWSRTPVNSSGTRLTLALGGGLEGPPTRQSRRTRSHPPPRSASEGIGGARGLGNLVRPESHPEPRGFPVQWADPGVS